MSDLRCQRHDNAHLQHAFNEYGEANFEFSILETFEFEKQEEIDAKEIHWIEIKDAYKNGYNCNPGGQANKPGWSKFSDEDIMAICAITKYLPHCGGVVAKMFNTTNTTVYRIRHRLSNPWQTEKFDILPEEEQRALYDSLQEEFHLIEQKYANMTWRRTRRTLSKECVFIAFIYQEYKGKLGWKAQLSQDYNIANMNTLAGALRHETYADYYEEYKRLSLEDKLSYLCHYMETYNRKPPELLENLIKDNQQST